MYEVYDKVIEYNSSTLKLIRSLHTVCKITQTTVIGSNYKLMLVVSHTLSELKAIVGFFFNPFPANADYSWHA